MRLLSIRIQNFRSFSDETIEFDKYTCLVGPNGSGKSAVLASLNVFFRNSASSATNVHQLIEEDFHHRDTSRPVVITLTFVDLSDAAQKDFLPYYRHGKLTVSAKATWDDSTCTADVRQHGVRLAMEQFAIFFRKQTAKAKVAELNEVYKELRKEWPDLPNETTRPAMEKALHDYEESHLELCQEIEATENFYGWTNGANLLSKYIQWVYVPAVKHASDEQEEGSKTALGQLLKRSVRSKVKFDEPIAELKSALRKSYEELLENNQQALQDIGNSIQQRLRDWSHPTALVNLKWVYDENKSVVVNQPYAAVEVGDDDFLGDIARLGHGVQRSFILSMLQVLAEIDGDAGPMMLLGIEEPELYQHPPQATHIASVLERLSETTSSPSQIIVTTHSPHFVSSKGFESVRSLSRTGAKCCSVVRRATSTPSVLRLTSLMAVKPPKNHLFTTPGAICLRPARSNRPGCTSGIWGIMPIGSRILC